MHSRLALNTDTRKTWIAVALILSGVIAALLSFAGFAICTIGEGLDPKHPAYFAFALSVTAALPAFLVFGLWSPSKPLILWVWLICVFAALFIMNRNDCVQGRCTPTNPIIILRSFLAEPRMWLVFSLPILGQLEASFGSRKMNMREETI
jgi:hypothetical protein